MTKPVPFPAVIEIRIKRTATHVDEDGDTAAVYEVSVDGAVVCTGSVALPPHDPKCPCDRANSVRTAVASYFCSRLFNLVPAHLLEMARAAEDEDDADEEEEEPKPRPPSLAERFLFGPPRPKSARRPS